jgi:hypothetical protein
MAECKAMRAILNIFVKKHCQTNEEYANIKSVANEAVGDKLLIKSH